MRTYTETDVEIQCLCSCEICGDWYWRPQAGIFVCDSCKQERQQNKADYRNRCIHKQPTKQSIHKAGAIFDIVVKYTTTGIKQGEILREMIKRGWKIESTSLDCLALLDYTGHLVYSDNDGRLYPYKNLNTGVSYE